MAHIIMTFSKMAFGEMTLSIMSFGKIALSIMTICKIILSKWDSAKNTQMTIKNTALSKMTLF